MTTPEGEWHVAQARAKFPSSAADLLRARTLEDDYRHLAQALHSGQRVLDVGCGTGSMTAGMAQLVAPVTVLGVDSNPVLLAEARQMYTNTVNLSFEQRDVYTLGFDSVFGVVVAARVLQWLSRPAEAIRQMVAALAPGGRLFVLDYNHLKAELTPPPPPEMRHFRERYLAWRSDAGMDNTLADHLSSHFLDAGLRDIEVVAQHETVHRADPDFERRIRLWGEVADTRGRQVVADGYVSEAERQAAVTTFRRWMADEAQAQTFYLLSVTGTKPS